LYPENPENPEPLILGNLKTLKLRNLDSQKLREFSKP
jgi:hypothetical protein